MHAASQGLLFPERVDLSVNEGVAYEAVADEFASLGFDISSLGGNSYALQGVPAGLDGLDPVRLMLDVVHSVMEQTGDAREQVRERMALSMAKSMAIVVGQELQQSEMALLVEELLETSMPQRTPDGNTIVYTLQDTEIARRFSK